MCQKKGNFFKMPASSRFAIGSAEILHVLPHPCMYVCMYVFFLLSWYTENIIKHKIRKNIAMTTEYIYAAIANSLRKRTNGHISCCRLGNSNDKFDNHVYKCKKNDDEPYFKLWVLMEVNDISKLLVYENHFHKRGMDTINKEKSKF